MWQRSQRAVRAGRTAQHKWVARVGADQGSVTAELAVGLSSVVVVLAAVLGVLTVGVAQLTVNSAATAGARVLARGGSATEATALASRLGGPGAQARAARPRANAPPGTPLVQVVVTREVRLPLPGRPQVRLRASAAAVDELAPP